MNNMKTNLYYKIVPGTKLYILKPNNHQIKNYNPSIILKLNNKRKQSNNKRNFRLKYQHNKVLNLMSNNKKRKHKNHNILSKLNI